MRYPLVVDATLANSYGTNSPKNLILNYIENKIEEKSGMADYKRACKGT